MIQSNFFRLTASFPVLSRSGSLRSISTLCLLALLLTSGTVRAGDPESDYTGIYIMISTGDDLNQKGDHVHARAKYLEAQKQLLEFQQTNPTWNNQIVNFRLNYLAEKIAAMDKAKTESARSAGAVKAKPVIKLVDAGTEPRKPLRLHPRAGDKQTVVTTSQSGMEMEAEGQEIPTKAQPGMKSTIEVMVKNVASSGDITYEAVLSGIEAVDENGDMGSDADKMKAVFEAMKGIKSTATVSDRGIEQSSRTEAPPGSDPKFRQSVAQMKDSVMPDLVVNLPEEAVGVGAKWTTTEKSKMQGISIEEITTAEIVSIEREVVTLKVTLVQTAPPQTVSSPGMPGLKLNMTQLDGTGGGSVTFDLGQTMPTKGTMKSHTEFSLGMNAGGQKKSMNMKLDQSTTIESK
jgi:hypothetical protein